MFPAVMMTKTKTVLSRRAWLQSLPGLEDDFPDDPLPGLDERLDHEQLVAGAPLVLAQLSGLAMLATKTTRVSEHSL